MTAEEKLAFYDDVLGFVFEEDIQEQFFWNGGLLANCNDFFWWGCADCEMVTPTNYPVLKQALSDLEALDLNDMKWAGLLFCARVRSLRPQGCCYPKDSRIAALFDACGPKRAVDLGNPYQHPEDGGKYAYSRSMDKPQPVDRVEP